MSIRIFYDKVKYRLRRSGRTVKIIDEVIGKEKKVTGDLYFIITDDKSLREINKEFLKHDCFTDVIAFEYNERKIINGEVYISIDSVRRNAYNYKVSLKDEILRVMIHGTLHLCGYNDETKSERAEMKKMEDSWLMVVNKE